jgi:hypothetical protein
MGPKRYVFSGVVVLCVALAAMSAVASGYLAGTWRTIAQRAAFPVYRPLQTLGLRFDGVELVPHTGCLTANWGNPKSYAGPHFGIGEPANTSRCGQPGVFNQVATTTINGDKVGVNVQCSAWPKCTVKDGETDGFFLLFVPEHVSAHYAIQLDSRHISLAHFLEIAKSFARVRAGAGGSAPAQLANFLSPDRKIWCLLQDETGDRAANCFFAADRSTGGQEYAAVLQPNGQLATCAWQPSQPGVQACDQNWDPSAPVLTSGKTDVIYQYRCQAASTAITCTVDTGAAKGKGFTISGTGVSRIP